MRFDGHDSALRLHALQQLLRASPPAADGDLQPSDAQCLLLVAGEDGRNNIGSQAAMKFLFLGGCGAELLEGTLDAEHADLDEVVLLIRPDSAAISYPDAARELVVPIIAGWRNVTELRVLHREALDTEVSELRKIKNFLRLAELGGDDVFGVPLPVRFDNEVEALESWPLIQAYALDEFGSGGFFTMHKRVVDMRPTLQRLLRDVDPVAARRLADEAVPLLEHQWRTFLADIDQVESPATRSSLSEEQLADTLLAAYSFGLIRRTAAGFVAPPGRGARLLLGEHTNDWHGTSDGRIIRTAGVNGAAAVHFTVEAEDPHTGLRVCRSYFLSCARAAPRYVNKDALVSSDNDDDDDDDDLERKADEPEEEEDEYDARDVERLFAIYDVLVRALQAGIAALQAAQGTDDDPTETVRAAAADVLVRGDVEDVEDLEVLVDAVDACGEPQQESSNQALTFVRLSLCNIFSVQQPGAVLGALAVGDSVLAAGAPLTACVPYFRSWMAEGREESSMVAQRRLLMDAHMCRGPPLQLGEFQTPVVPDVTMLLPSALMPRVAGSVRLYSEGLAFLSTAFTQLVLSIEQDVSEMGIASCNDTDDVLWMRLRGSPNTKLDVTLPLPPDEPVVGFVLGEDDALRGRVTQLLAPWHRAAKLADVPFDSRAAHELPAALAAPATPAAEGPAEDPAEEDEDEDETKTSDPVPVTLLLGLPGSGVDAVARALVDFSSGDNDWELLCVEGGLEASAEELRRQLVAALFRLDERRGPTGGGAGGRRLRLCVAVTGFDDPAAVVPVVLREATARVACVAAVVSLRGLYCDERRAELLPRLLDQCAPAWCNAVLLADGSAEPDEDRLMRMRLRAAAPRGTVLRLERTGLSGVDVEVLASLTAFADDAFARGLRARGAPARAVAALPRGMRALDVQLRCRVDRGRFLALACALLPHVRVTTVAPKAKPAGLRRARDLARARVLGLESKGDEGAAESKDSGGEEEDEEDEEAVRDEMAAAAKAVGGHCWTLRARLTCADGKTYAFDGGRLRAADAAAECSLSACGVGMDADALRAALLLCRPPQRHARRALRTRESVTRAELDDINRRAVEGMGADGPPPGYTFDGRFFIDFTGARQTQHPEIEVFVESFLNAANEEILENNALAEEEEAELERELAA